VSVAAKGEPQNSASDLDHAKTSGKFNSLKSRCTLSATPPCPPSQTPSTAPPPGSLCDNKSPASPPLSFLGAMHRARMPTILPKYRHPSRTLLYKRTLPLYCWNPDFIPDSIKDNPKARIAFIRKRSKVFIYSVGPPMGGRKATDGEVATGKAAAKIPAPLINGMQGNVDASPPETISK